ncbi:MAG TPA: hypothetical protein VKY26_11120, partial [Actinomycetota bacterium]|nr:hypothetical protein [Actinomycetota bacterium]
GFATPGAAAGPVPFVPPTGGPAGPAAAAAGAPSLLTPGGNPPLEAPTSPGDDPGNDPSVAANTPTAPTAALAAPGGAWPVTQAVPYAGGSAPAGQAASWQGATPPWGTGAPQWATPSWGGAGGGPATPFPPTAWAQTAPVARVKAPKERSPLGRITFAAALVVLGVTALIDRLGIAHVSGRLYPALALIVLGAGLLIGAFWGRAKLLILVGVVVVPIALITNLAVYINHNGSGAELFHPATTAALRGEYRLGAGQMRLDLTRMAWPSSGSVTTHVDMGAGNVEIAVPAGVTVDFHGHVGAGVIQFHLIYGPARSGLQISDHAISSGTSGGATLNLWVHVLAGRIAVDRTLPDAGVPAPAKPAVPKLPLPIPTASLPTPAGP